MTAATAYGNSYLQDFETCPRLFKYKHLDGLVAPPALTLSVGSAVHAGVAEWYRRKSLDPMRSAEALALAFASLAEAYSEIDDPILADDYVKALLITERTLHGYFDYYRQETEYETLELEVELDFPLDADGQRYTGRLDRVVRSKADGMVYIMEHKTSGEHATTFFKRFEIAPAITGYVWLAQQRYEEPIGGVIVNGLFKPRVNPPKKDGSRTLGEPSYLRETFIRTKVEIDEWAEETLIKRKRITDLMALNDPRQWTKRETSCTRFNRTCEFIDVCKHQQADFVMAAFRERGDRQREDIAE